ncbi:MAG: hypothetical protein HFG75_10135 [Hungatella sp.]|nr:hypothetical protein [Hungatella sp.]
MLNEEKIKLMTGIGMFEKREGKRVFLSNRFFRSDYIGRYLLRGFLGFTFCWLMGTALVVLYRAESFLSAFDFRILQDFLGMYVTGYAGGLALYLLITCVVYWRRYEYAARGMKVYVAKLKRLEKRYELQGKMGHGGKKL